MLALRVKSRHGCQRGTAPFERGLKQPEGVAVNAELGGVVGVEAARFGESFDYVGGLRGRADGFVEIVKLIMAGIRIDSNTGRTVKSIKIAEPMFSEQLKYTQATTTTKVFFVLPQGNVAARGAAMKAGRISYLRAFHEKGAPGGSIN